MSGVCHLCRAPMRVGHYEGKLVSRCTCSTDWRTPLQKRRDAVLDRYGPDPDAYTPAVLKQMAADGVLDITAAFCPAGKLSMAETKAREAQQRGEA